MVDITQILLTIVVTVLTLLLTVVGIQIIYILREFRKTIKKMNKILDDSGLISETVSKQISSFSGLITGITSGLSILNFFKRKNPPHS